MSIEHLPDFDESPLWHFPDAQTSTGYYRAEPSATPTVELPRDWTKGAACIEHLDLFDVLYWDADGNAGMPKGYRDTVQQCRALCQACPVSDECLSFALEMEVGSYNQHRYGMFGGLMPAERKALIIERAS